MEIQDEDGELKPELNSEEEEEIVSSENENNESNEVIEDENENENENEYDFENDSDQSSLKNYGSTNRSFDDEPNGSEYSFQRMVEFMEQEKVRQAQRAEEGRKLALQRIRKRRILNMARVSTQRVEPSGKAHSRKVDAVKKVLLDASLIISHSPTPGSRGTSPLNTLSSTLKTIGPKVDTRRSPSPNSPSLSHLTDLPLLPTDLSHTQNYPFSNTSPESQIRLSPTKSPLDIYFDNDPQIIEARERAKLRIKEHLQEKNVKTDYQIQLKKDLDSLRKLGVTDETINNAQILPPSARESFIEFHKSMARMLPYVRKKYEIEWMNEWVQTNQPVNPLDGRPLSPMKKGRESVSPSRIEKIRTTEQSPPSSWSGENNNKNGILRSNSFMEKQLEMLQAKIQQQPLFSSPTPSERTFSSTPTSNASSYRNVSPTPSKQSQSGTPKQGTPTKSSTPTKQNNGTPTKQNGTPTKSKKNNVSNNEQELSPWE
eukprot:TRINITY_DN551_c0_g1_i1.p1 TRINITY_DN551_c0_g1~~TRINITY_DN551_c0_g1_i1.p1  ORF type:complete len:486 (+),score=127.60 TRINITY_DN551_c0_g1_i1:196-1653(+)